MGRGVHGHDHVDVGAGGLLDAPFRIDAADQDIKGSVRDGDLLGKVFVLRGDLDGRDDPELFAVAAVLFRQRRILRSVHEGGIPGLVQDPVQGRLHAVRLGLGDQHLFRQLVPGFLRIGVRPCRHGAAQIAQRFILALAAHEHHVLVRLHLVPGDMIHEPVRVVHVVTAEHVDRRQDQGQRQRDDFPGALCPRDEKTWQDEHAKQCGHDKEHRQVLPGHQPGDQDDDRADDHEQRKKHRPDRGKAREPIHSYVFLPARGSAGPRAPACCSSLVTAHTYMPCSCLIAQIPLTYFRIAASVPIRSGVCSGSWLKS